MDLRSQIQGFACRPSAVAPPPVPTLRVWLSFTRYLLQIVILGTGKKALEASVKNLSKSFPGLAAGIVQFSNPLAHLITAGSDFMLVPSRFEPCGLIQLHAMQVGSGVLEALAMGALNQPS